MISKKMVALYVATGLVAFPCSVPAQTAPAGACVQLAKDYDDISKSLSQLVAESVGDNSAPRETIRQTKVAGLYGKAGVLVQLMTANRCAAPKSAPSSDTYLGAAMICETELITKKATDPEVKAACDRSKWSGKTK